MLNRIKRPSNTCYRHEWCIRREHNRLMKLTIGSVTRLLSMQWTTSQQPYCMKSIIVNYSNGWYLYWRTLRSPGISRPLYTYTMAPHPGQVAFVWHYTCAKNERLWATMWWLMAGICTPRPAWGNGNGRILRFYHIKRACWWQKFISRTRFQCQGKKQGRPNTPTSLPVLGRPSF